MKKLILLAAILAVFTSCETKPVVLEIYPPNDTTVVDTIPLYLGRKGGIRNSIEE